MNKSKKETKKIIRVGMVRPISSMGDKYTPEHWNYLHEIIQRALSDDDNFSFKFSLVSDSIGSHFIHSTIIKNLYDNDVVICDTTKHNPNVLFELGLRMSFQKPCVIIQEKNQTTAFDINLIKYEEYPFDFNYFEILQFQNNIREAVISCYQDFYIHKQPVSYSSIFHKAGIESERINSSKIYFDLQETKESCYDIVSHFKKIGFIPDIIYTFGSKTGILSYFISNAFENNPLPLIGHMEYIQHEYSNTIEKSSPQKGFTLIKNDKWMIYIPDTLLSDNKKKILIIDDIAFGGDSIMMLKKRLLRRNFILDNIKSATIACTKFAAVRHKKDGLGIDYYNTLVEHENVYFLWGKAK